MRAALIISIFIISLVIVRPAPGAGSDKITSPASGGQTISTERGDIVITPIEHATFVIQWDGKSLFIDPVGGAKVFRKFRKPDIILITDIHSDHLDWDTVKSLISTKTRIVAPRFAARRTKTTTRKTPKSTRRTSPKALKDRIDALSNGSTVYIEGIVIKAIPMYNLSSDRARYHTKGRGNGYLIKLGDKWIYVSGDTEDIPEMRELENIEAAFICMNSPYTMEVEQAASAVLEFKPKIVFPYHYRNRDGTFSDLEKFKELVGKDKDIEVRLLNWYP